MSRAQSESNWSSLEGIIASYAYDESHSSAAADAPELDQAVNAPQCRGEHQFPEVRLGSGAQVFYNNAPPEAISRPSANNERSEAKSIEILSVPKNKIKLFICTTIVLLVVTGLGLGLGLGLTQGKSNHPLEPLTTLRPQTTSNVPTSSSLYSSRASETPLPVLKQRLLDDTSIGAIALPNGNRWLFFQDITGAIRHATFSAKAGVWQSSIKLETISDAKNYTPLAVTNTYFRDGLELIYVSTKSNTLRSVSFYKGSIQKTDLYVRLELSDIKVAPDSRKLSAVAVSPNTDVPGILLFYEHPARKLNIMYGFEHLNANSEHSWTWQNLTHQISSLILDSWRGYQIAAPCSAHWEDLSDEDDERVSFISCFANVEDVAYRIFSQYSRALVQAYFNISPRGNITIRKDTGTSPVNDTAATNLILLHGDVMAWSNKTSLAMEGAPLSISPFPYKPLAGTSKVNTTDSYIYHQLNEKTIAEEYWDGGRSDFWITRNITINAS